MQAHLDAARTRCCFTAAVTACSSSEESIVGIGFRFSPRVAPAAAAPRKSMTSPPVQKHVRASDARHFSNRVYGFANRKNTPMVSKRVAGPVRQYKSLIS
jgi:hypothetical protein